MWWFGRPRSILARARSGWSRPRGGASCPRCGASCPRVRPRSRASCPQGLKSNGCAVCVSWRAPGGPRAAPVGLTGPRAAPVGLTGPPPIVVQSLTDIRGATRRPGDRAWLRMADRSPRTNRGRCRVCGATEPAHQPWGGYLTSRRSANEPGVRQMRARDRQVRATCAPGECPVTTGDMPATCVVTTGERPLCAW